MFACVLGLVFANFSEPNFQILKTKPKNTADIFSYVKNLPMPFVTQEFFGSVNFDDNVSQNACYKYGFLYPNFSIPVSYFY